MFAIEALVPVSERGSLYSGVKPGQGQAVRVKLHL